MLSNLAYLSEVTVYFVGTHLNVGNPAAVSVQLKYFTVEQQKKKKDKSRCYEKCLNLKVYKLQI